MSNIFQGPDGQLYFHDRRRDQMVPIDERQADYLAHNEGAGPATQAINRFIDSQKAIAGGQGTLLGGVGELLGIPGADSLRQGSQRLVEDSGMRSPYSDLLQYATDVAGGAVVGGIGRGARGLARVGGTEAGLGAARNPDDPVTGAAIQGAAGMAGAAGVNALVRGGPRAARVFRHNQDNITHPGMMSVRELDELGIPLTVGQRSAVRAGTMESRAVRESLGADHAIADLPVAGRGIRSALNTQETIIGQQIARTADLPPVMPREELLRRVTELENRVMQEAQGHVIPVNRSLLQGLDNLPTGERQIMEGVAQQAQTGNVRADSIIRMRKELQLGNIKSEQGELMVMELVQDLHNAAPNIPHLDRLELLRFAGKQVDESTGLVDISRAVTGLRDKGLIRPGGEVDRLINTAQFLQQHPASVSERALSGKALAGIGVIPGLGWAYGQGKEAIQNLQ